MAGLPQFGSARRSHPRARNRDGAGSTGPTERRRDVDQTYNPMTRAQLRSFAPQFQWDRNARQARASNCAAGRLSVSRARLPPPASCLRRRPAATWKEYLAFHFVSDHAPFLPKAFDDAAFDFYSQDAARGSRSSATGGSAASTSSTERSAKAVGQLYVQRHYPPESDRQMGELVANIRAALAREDRDAQLDGCGDPEGRAGEARPASIRASATRPNRSIIRPSRSIAATSSATPCGPSSSTGICSFAAIPSRSTALCGT